MMRCHLTVSILLALLVTAPIARAQSSVGSVSVDSFGNKSWKAPGLPGVTHSLYDVSVSGGHIYYWSGIAWIDFALTGPKGDKGDKGDIGTTGADGVSGTNGINGQTPSVSVNSTTTLSSGSSASASNSGTSLNVLLDFGIPRGANGTNGTNGINGANGIDGQPRTIATAGIALTVRPTVNFVNLSAVDNAATLSTDIFFPLPLSIISLGCPTRTVRVNSALSSGDGTCWFTSISSAVAYINTQRVSSPTSHQYDGNNWLIELYSGYQGTAANPSTFLESGNLVIPGQVTIQSVSRGSYGGVNTENGMAEVQLTCSSGDCLTFGGGVTSDHVRWYYTGTPTAAMRVIVLNKSAALSGSTNQMIFSNSQVFVRPAVTTFQVDGVTLVSGQAFLADSAVTMSGGSAGATYSTASRALVNLDAVSGDGIVMSNGQLTGQTSCVTLVRNQTASGGAVRLFGVQITPLGRCTLDLVNDGTGPLSTGNGMTYGATSGAITTYGVTYNADCSGLLASACSPRAQCMDTTAAAERICICSASGAWLCKGWP